MKGRLEILSDEGGAVMLFGVFLAVFLVGMLYYLVGVGEAVLYRQRTQDAADAAALSAAIMHARGMNLIVLINLIMAALMSVLLALKLLLMLITIAMAVVSALIWVPAVGAGTALPLLTALNNLRTSVDRTHHSLESSIFPMLTQLRTLARAIRVVTPHVAQVGVIREVVSHYRPPAQFGFMLPQRTTLPVEDDRFDVLCKHAARNLAPVALLPFSRVPGFGLVEDEIKDAAGNMAQSLSSYFCGGGGGKPSHTTTIRRAFPMSDSMQRCAKEMETRAHAGTNDACRRAEQERELAEAGPDGNCRPGRDCSAGGAYERFRSLARRQCNPKHGGQFENFSWQERRVRETITWDGTQWLRGEMAFQAGQVRTADRPPCGDHGNAIGTGWNEQLHSVTAPRRLLPVCVEQAKLGPNGRQPGESRHIEYLAVTQILSCERGVQETFTMQDVEPHAGPTDDKVPQRVEEGLELGAEDFQMRVAVVNSRFSSAAYGIIKVASWGQCDAESDSSCQGSLSQKSVELSRLSVAQAEYYFEGAVEPSEWMWNMNWRGRLKRFRVHQKSRNWTKAVADPEIAQFGGIDPARDEEQACTRQGSECSQVSAFFANGLSGLVLH